MANKTRHHHEAMVQISLNIPLRLRDLDYPGYESRSELIIALLEDYYQKQSGVQDATQKRLQELQKRMEEHYKPQTLADAFKEDNDFLRNQFLKKYPETDENEFRGILSTAEYVSRVSMGD